MYVGSLHFLQIYQELENWRIMEKLEQLRRNTEKAYQSALKAMIELVDAITEERNYYRELCKQKDAKFQFVAKPTAEGEQDAGDDNTGGSTTNPSTGGGGIDTSGDMEG